MKEDNVPPSGDEMRMADFSEVMALIFVTVVIVGSVISILFF